jgi:hypothetical protein
MGWINHVPMQGAAVEIQDTGIREALAVGDQIGALRIIARFFDRSCQRR